jgi:hypothetical protein
MLPYVRQLLAGWLFWLMLGILVLAGAAAALWHAREWAMADLSGSSGRQAWHDWKEHTRKLASSGGPVARRPVQADEPPALVLLRDHFATVLAACLTLLAALLGFIGFVVRGILRSTGAAIRATAGMPRQSGAGGSPAHPPGCSGQPLSAMPVRPSHSAEAGCPTSVASACDRA